jgi:glycosyltransferase involved in cell wall biosynthesis
MEVYLKAADVMVLPYNEIFQSGVLFLGYSFGLPVIATDVGSFREEIVEGERGFCAVRVIPRIWPKRSKHTSPVTFIGTWVGHGRK